MELDTVNVHSLIGMEQGSSKDLWISRDCLFDSDTLQEIFHMDIRCCNNTDRFDCPDLGFDFGDVLALEETQEDLIGFNDSRSRNSDSNLKELNHLDEFSDDDLANTLVNLNSVLPRNLSMPVRNPVLDNKRPILEMNVENIAENKEEDTENESETERTENDGESEEEEEEEIENEENERNETEYETEEESQEEEEEEEEEMEADETEGACQRSFTPSSMEALTISPSSIIGDSRSLTASSSPTVQLMRVHMQPSKMNSVSGMIKLHDIKTLATNSNDQISQHVRKQIYNNNVHDVNSGTTTMMIQTTKRDKNLMARHRDNPYPKPAYSYSCLIAMALKNSRTGSLPVSEIYNFMCRHFPYFKTAPNGWKNSVRHNLSLNKCFEKIEKPPGNGSQRKGCLWAIHPSKIAKMDEEVRKWSRKDPIAIKQAMIHPDHLELLERGDMKYGNDKHEEIYEDADSYVDSGGSAEDEIIENINDEENIIQETEKLNRKHINTINDDIVDDDIIVEQFYDEFDIENATDNDTLLDAQLSIPKQKQSFMYEIVSCAKRQKTLLSSSMQNDHIYQQTDTSSRKKTHLVALRPGTTPSSELFRE